MNFIAVIAAICLISCKPSVPSSEADISSNGAVNNTENDVSINESEDDLNEKQLEETSDSLKTDFVEGLDLEFVYEKFDTIRVLERLNLSALLEKRSIQELLAADLREGDKLVQDILETGDGTFDIYKLVDVYKNELAFFYYESDYIGTIEIVHSGGVPDAMIRPGLTFEELSKTYDNPIAYGSEIEARVFIHEEGVGFRMDTSYGIYEPIDLEDDTEILYIQF